MSFEEMPGEKGPEDERSEEEREQRAKNAGLSPDAPWEEIEAAEEVLRPANEHKGSAAA